MGRPTPKFQLRVLDESKEDFDEYSRYFERVARMQDWDPDAWAVYLGNALTGKDVLHYNTLPERTACDYGLLKKYLLNRFQLTAECYRTSIRKTKQEEGESASQ